MKKTEVCLYIYRNQTGLRARIASDEEFAKARKYPGVKVIAWEGREQFPFDFTVATNCLDAEEVDYLCETQISLWPVFQNGQDIRGQAVSPGGVKGGIGGS